VPDGREHAHVEPALGDDDLRGVRLDAGDRAQQLDDVGMRGEHELDPLGQVLQLGIERVDVRQQLRDHHAVMLDREAALQRLAELRDLGAHLPAEDEQHGDARGDELPPELSTEAARREWLTRALEPEQSAEAERFHRRGRLAVRKAGAGTCANTSSARTVIMRAYA